ncbi:MAG: hypothetical protein AAF493_15910 [Pseudomonadota bacterium]
MALDILNRQRRHRTGPPLSDDWLRWDPESIDTYPHQNEAANDEGYVNVFEDNSDRSRRILASHRLDYLYFAGGALLTTVAITLLVTVLFRLLA